VGQAVAVVLRFVLVELAVAVVILAVAGLGADLRADLVLAVGVQPTAGVDAGVGHCAVGADHRVLARVLGWRGRLPGVVAGVALGRADDDRLGDVVGVVLWEHCGIDERAAALAARA